MIGQIYATALRKCCSTKWSK